MAKIERTYNIPLRHGFSKVPQHRRSKRAVSELKQFLSKHMKSDNVKIGKVLNEHIWQDGIRKPPHHVLVDVVKDDDGIVRAELSGYKYVDFKPQEKTEEKGTLKDKLTSRLGPKESSEKAEVEDKTSEERTKPIEKKTAVEKKDTPAKASPKSDTKPVQKSTAKK
ncbi:60S ribosomal protein L31 [Candidatus Woesearchaeota archaeon]|nr:60S ribosomal protein L31 [Candidatus Woesearchaeota archaeon]